MDANDGLQTNDDHTTIRRYLIPNRVRLLGSVLREWWPGEAPDRGRPRQKERGCASGAEVRQGLATGSFGFV